MLIIPAIDIQGGKCVRLTRGDMDSAKVYSEDPVAMADHWAKAGASRIHIVDLDGAKHGKPVHADLIHEIADAHPEVDIQVGGGIRDEDTIQEYLNAGVRYVVIGTKAVSAPHFVPDVCAEFPTHIIVGLDVRDGKVAIDGWSKLSRHDAIDLAQQFEGDGVAEILFTDISRDGTLEGVNIGATVAMAQALHIPVIASGGFSSLDDVRALCEVEDEGVGSVVLGRALYEGTVDFGEAKALAASLSAG